MKKCLFIVTALLISILTGCDTSAPDAKPAGTEPTSKQQGTDQSSLAEKQNNNSNQPIINSLDNNKVLEYKTINWVDLMPADDLDALLNPPEYLDEVEDGSLEDQIANQIKSQLDVDPNDPYQQALVSTKTIAEMQGKMIRLPGFIVPLRFGEQEFQITQFFIVPFFGACIHVPPPPPNQIIFVDYPKGVELASLQDAFWFSGQLHIEITDNETGTSAYTLDMHQFELYQ